MTQTDGQDYLERIPAGSHDALGEVRDGQLAMIKHALRIAQRGKGVGVGRSERGLAKALGNMPCR